MIKLFTTDDWAWDSPATAFLPVHSNGLDHGFMQKFARSELQKDWLSTARPVKGHSLIHVIAVADSDAFGYNRNADGFCGKDNKRTHPLFVTNAHYFRNHKNNIKKHPHFGRPVMSFYHPDMKRIELIIAANNDTAGDIVHKMESGRGCTVSMGADVPFDVCTVCGNKARSRKEYCEHARSPRKGGGLGRLLNDGQLCALDNPDAEWFDISDVERPAERIAHGIRLIKLACGDAISLDDRLVIGGAERAKVAGIVLPDDVTPAQDQLRKWAALQSLASIEKHVPVDVRAIITPDDLPDDAVKVIHKKAMNDGHLGNVMEDLHGRGVLLRPGQLFQIAFGPENFASTIEPLMNEVRSLLPDVFSRALEDGGGDLVHEGRFDGCGGTMMTAMPREYRDIAHTCESCASTHEPHVEGRSLRKAVMGPPRRRKTIIIKTAQHSPAAKGLADLYGAYGLALSSHFRNGRSLLTKRAVVMTNHEESHS